MATDASYLEYVCDQADLGAALTWKKMFGEYALYVDGRVVALLCDNQLFVKPTDAGRRLLGDVAEGAPYPGAKPHLRVDADLEERDRLGRVLLATAAALPLPKAKPAKKAASKAKPEPKAKTKPSAKTTTNLAAKPAAKAERTFKLTPTPMSKASRKST